MARRTSACPRRSPHRASPRGGDPDATRTALCILVALTVVISSLGAAAPIRVMLLDGESAGTYHDWQRTTPVLRKMLDETGLFEVAVVTAPQAGGDPGGFKPDFGK